MLPFSSYKHRSKAIGITTHPRPNTLSSTPLRASISSPGTRIGAPHFPTKISLSPLPIKTSCPVPSRLTLLTSPQIHRSVQFLGALWRSRLPTSRPCTRCSPIRSAPMRACASRRRPRSRSPRVALGSALVSWR